MCCLQYDKKVVISGSYDRTVKLVHPLSLSTCCTSLTYRYTVSIHIDAELTTCSELVYMVAYNERVITVRIGWVLLASATSGFSGYIKLAYCSSAKGAPVAQLVRACD